MACRSQAQRAHAQKKRNLRNFRYDRVGIGTDFNHGSSIIGFDSEADAPNVTAELVRRRYSEAQIPGIWEENFLRVLRAAQAARAK